MGQSWRQLKKAYLTMASVAVTTAAFISTPRCDMCRANIDPRHTRPNRARAGSASVRSHSRPPAGVSHAQSFAVSLSRRRRARRLLRMIAFVAKLLALPRPLRSQTTPHSRRLLGYPAHRGGREESQRGVTQPCSDAFAPSASGTV